MSVVQVLQNAKARIGTNERWAKGRFALDKDGFGVGVDSPEACSFCSYGAVLKELYALYGGDNTEIESRATELLDKGANVLFGRGGIVILNDDMETTLDMVHEVFDWAIQQEEGA